MNESRIPTSRLEEIARINLEARAELEKALGSISEREAMARRLVDECEKDRKEIEFKLAALAQAEDIYRSVFGVTEPQMVMKSMRKRLIMVESKSHPQSRARIGAQRYRMLKNLQIRRHSESEFGMTLAELAEACQFDTKRVRDQISSDIANGIVLEANDKFYLTEAGANLISDFEESRKSRGVPLPPLEGPLHPLGQVYTLRQLMDGADHDSDNASSPTGEEDGEASHIDVSDL